MFAMPLLRWRIMSSILNVSISVYAPFYPSRLWKLVYNAGMIVWLPLYFVYCLTCSGEKSQLQRYLSSPHWLISFYSLDRWSQIQWIPSPRQWRYHIAYSNSWLIGIKLIPACPCVPKSCSQPFKKYLKNVVATKMFTDLNTPQRHLNLNNSWL